MKPRPAILTILISLNLAAKFLTVLPLPDSGRPSPGSIGLSLSFYPLIGLGLGLILAGAGAVIGGVPELLAAALLLCLWVGITGGLHLDGLADTADSLGGVGWSRQRRLEVMKDSNIGAWGACACFLALIIKFAGLAALLEADQALALLWLPPLLGRSAILLLFLTTAYIRSSGLGSPLQASPTRPIASGGVGWSRQRRLEVMKDSNIGAWGACACFLALIIKFAGLAALLEADQALALLWLPPLLGRSAILLLFLTTAYIRSSGLGSPLQKQLRPALLWLSLLLAASVCSVAGAAGFVALAVAAVFVLALRALMLKFFGGMTGDTLGSAVELVEVATLVALAVGVVD